MIDLFQNAQKKSANKLRESVYINDVSQPLDVLEGQHQEQRTVLQEITNEQVEYNELLISEREAEIENIEQGVIELNEIFRDMSFVVSEQESGIRKLYV